MAYLSDASSSVADFDKFVISFLYRVPQSTILSAIPPGFLEFGQTTDGPSAIISLIDGTMLLIFCSAHLGYIYTIGGGPSSGITLQPIIQSPALTPAGDTWRRAIFSGDFSSGASFTNTGGSTFSLVSNDFRIWLSVDDIDYSATSFTFGSSSFTSQPAGSFIPGIGVFAGGSNIVLPGFTIPINGLELGIPCLSGNADPSYNSPFELADFMMWTGVSLDTSSSTNRRLFINADGSAVSPAVAIAALGTPVYDFRGPASGISTNRGSAGSATLTGTVTDHTPGP